MKAALIVDPQQAPVVSDFAEPVARDGFELIDVTAAALTNLTKARATGGHYSSSGSVPNIAGIDGVGRTQRGERVYFMMPEPPFGAMAEKTIVRAEQCLPVPFGVSDVVAAAIANPAMSSLAALKYRAAFKRGETVLINGATGAAGSVAIQLAKAMGALRVIATGRDPQGLERALRIGADVAIDLTLPPDDLFDEFADQFAHDGVDVVLDYLFGPSAETMFNAIGTTKNSGKSLRYIEIGNASGKTASLPGWVLRSTPIAIMGSGLGSVSTKDLIDAVGDALRAVVPARLEIHTTEVPLASVARVWNDATKSRVVISI
ncbi:MAG TPA: zinc-binding alcohol dehydrogenase family protein [Candidatus Acidoferrales bacterium]|nr:zinc-binding alcohol dehydrogenase family protein [Candidatus Acidoferrales bacterium]